MHSKTCSQSGSRGTKLRLTWVAVVLALAGCHGGGLDTGSGDTTGDGQDGGGDDSNLGDVVAEIQVAAPERDWFILRATVPMPRGTWLPHEDPRQPFAVIGPDRKTLITQTNVVTRYPRRDDGVAVAEVMARAPRPETAEPGDPLTFKVALMPHEQGDMAFNPGVRKLLGTPGALMLRTRDVFSNSYEADLFAKVLEKDPSARKPRAGQLVHEYVTHEVLRPLSPKGGAQGTLPHMMGVHTYVTTYDREEYFSLDLHVHNGMDGLDKSDDVDDALAQIYFDRLELVLPRGWRMLSFLDSPSLGKLEQHDRANVYPLIKGLGNNKLNMMPMQSRLVRRMVVYRQGAKQHALEALGAGHLGFCRAGQAPSGAPYWSWWNDETSCFLSQAARLPDLKHLGLKGLANELTQSLSNRRGQLAEGSTGNYPLSSGVVGWAQPWGVTYGGMTGGDEINIFDGLRTVATASEDGYEFALLTSRCYMDRQPTALFDAAGQPTCVEDLLVEEGFGAPYVNCTFFITPSDSSDPFGFNDAPVFQTAAVQATNRVPAYQDGLEDWMPIDYQHYIRFTRTLKILAWLGNDSLAKDQLRAAAAVFRLSFHQLPNSKYGYTQSSGLLSKINHVLEFPGQGVDFQRGAGWGLDCTVAAYAMGDDELRGNLYPWFEIITDTVADGQSTCTGNIMATQVGKIFDGDAYVRMIGHSSYADNALRGVQQHVFSGCDDELAEQIGDMIVDNAYAQISPGFWNEADGRPYAYVGVGMSDEAGEFCNDIPDWAKSTYTYISYYSSFAYAYERSKDKVFLYRVIQMMGGGDDLQTLLEDNGVGQLELMAGLLALVQEIPSN